MPPKRGRDLVDVVEDMTAPDLGEIPDMRPKEKKRKEKSVSEPMELQKERQELLELYMANPGLMKITQIPNVDFIQSLSPEEVKTRLQAARMANDYGADQVLSSQALNLFGTSLEMMWPDYLSGLGEELDADDDFGSATQMWLTTKLLSKMSSSAKWGLATSAKVGKVVARNLKRRRTQASEVQPRLV